MRREVWFGWMLWALAAPVAAVKVPGCGELTLADCLGVPPPGLEFPDQDPLAQPSLERPPGLDDRRWREALERGLKRGEFPPAQARIELAWLALRRDEARRAQALLQEAAAEVGSDAALERRRLWMRGHACAAAGDFDCALSEWHRVGALRANRVEWLPRYYAYALWGLGRHEQALAWYSTAVRGEAYLGRGIYAARSGGGPALDKVARELFEAWSQRYAPLAATVVAEADIDAEGRVSRVKLLDSPLDPALLTRIQGTVAGWRFTPAVVDGRPVSLSTHLHIDVRGRPAAAGGYQFEIQYTGAGVRTQRAEPPPYPPAALRRYQQGEVMLKITVAPDGRVGAVSVESSSGYPILDRAAVEAASEWTFKPDRLDGEPIAGEVLVPVQFVLTSSGADRVGSQLYLYQQRLFQLGPSVF